MSVNMTIFVNFTHLVLDLSVIFNIMYDCNEKNRFKTLLLFLNNINLKEVTSKTMKQIEYFLLLFSINLKKFINWFSFL